MSEVLALSMLYEILVSESKYESRGIDYRTKLKALYHQLLKERQIQNETNHKVSKQSSNKLIECLSDAIKVLDPTQIQSNDLELCYGIHQYVFPKIPDFNALDIRFISKWNKFYNAFPEYSKLPDRKSKRQTEKQKTYQMSKRRNIRESDSSSESDEAETFQDLQVLMTEEDFGKDGSEPKRTKLSEVDKLTKVEDPGANLPMVDEPEGHVKLPLVMNKDVEITEDSIVFGLMDDEKLVDWVSTSSMHNYDELYKEMYSCDPTLKCFLAQNKGSKPKEEIDAFDLLAREANFDMNDGPEYDEIGRAEYFSEDDTDDSFYSKEYKSDLSDGCDKNDSLDSLSGVKSESAYSSSNTSNSEEPNEQLIGTSDFYKEAKVKTLPGNYKQNTEKFEVDSIFGNYYCPVSTTSDNAPSVQEFQPEKKKRGRPRKNKPPTPTNTSFMDGIERIELITTASDLGIKTEPEQMDNVNRGDNLERVDPSNLMNVKTFTVNFMEVESTYSCNNTGGFEVRCSATIKDPFVSGIMKGKMDPAMGVYQELQEMLKKLFLLKKQITGNCSVCSGWNLLHGIAQSFCEYCEDKLVNSDPELILKIFEIRRQLVSNLYPIVGYKYDTLDLFEEGELVHDWRELLNQQKVSIQSLIQVGASFPKSSLHDSRFLPSPVILPVTMCNTINTFQYPKSNLNLPPIHINLNSLTKEELDIQVNTPFKNSSCSFSINNSYSCSSSYQETCSNSSKCGSSSLNDSLSFDAQDYTDNTSRRLHTYGLLDIVNQRRYNRAKMLNDLFEHIYNAYHSKSNLERSSQLISNYNNVFKNGLLLSSRLVGPYNEPSDDEVSSESDSSSFAESEKDDTPASNLRTRKNNEENDNTEENKEKKKKEKKYNNKNNNKETKEKQKENKEKEKEMEKDEKENYYDEESSFVLSRLPLDTDMIKYSFYHKGVFLTKKSNAKSYVFVDIGKMFGFREVLEPRPENKSEEDNENSSREDNDREEENDKNQNKERETENNNKEDEMKRNEEQNKRKEDENGSSVSSKSSNDYVTTPSKYLDADEQEETSNPVNNEMTPDSFKDRFGFSSESPFEDCVFTDPDFVNEFELKLEKINNKENEDTSSKDNKEENKIENEKETENENTDNDKNKDNEEVKEVEKREEVEDKEDDEDDSRDEDYKELERETSFNPLSSGRSSEFEHMVFNYNWHEVLYRYFSKRPSLADEQPSVSKVLKEMLKLDEEFLSDGFSEYDDDGFVDSDQEDYYLLSGNGSREYNKENNKNNKETKEKQKENKYKIEVDKEKNKEVEMEKEMKKKEKEKETEEKDEKREESIGTESQDSCTDSDSTGSSNRNKKNPVNMQMMRMMYETGMLQKMPVHILNNLYNTGKIKIGFPTSLEMYMLNIPDSIMDCTMYGGVGKGFHYSLDAIINNLSILSPIMRVGTVGGKRRKTSKT